MNEAPVINTTASTPTEPELVDLAKALRVAYASILKAKAIAAQLVKKTLDGLEWECPAIHAVILRCDRSLASIREIEGLPIQGHLLAELGLDPPLPKVPRYDEL